MRRSITSADWSLTPRPLYFADGLKLPGVYGRPLDFWRRIEAEMGDDFAGRTGPNAGQRTAEDAYYMATTGVT